MDNDQAVPAELIIEICSYLSQKDVASFRLTCKRHAELGAEHLVKELHVMFRPKSFQNLINIASHPVFPNHVHSIFYEADIAHFAIDHDIWVRHVTKDKKVFKRSRTPRPEADEDHKTSVSRSYLFLWETEQEMQDLYAGQIKQKYSKMQISRGWSAFKHIQEETGSIAETNEDVKAMVFAFGKFANLKEVCMQTEGKVTDAMKASFKKALYLPSLDILPAIMPDSERGFHTGTRQLSAILEATVSSGIPLTSLTVGKLDWSFFGNEPIYYDQVQSNKRFKFEDSFWAKPYEKRLQPAFQNLVNVDFRFEDLWKDDYLDMDEEEDRHAKLGKALKSAKKLESLAMHFGDTEESMYHEGDMVPPVKLGKLVGGLSLDRIIWPKLKFLELHSVASTYEGWMSFMEKHSETLQTLCLSSLNLTYGDDEDEDELEDEDRPVPSWSRLLTALRETLHGKHVEFRGVFTVEEDYMFTGENDYREDEGWLSMDRPVPVGLGESTELVRFGKLVQQWFVDDLGTENNPIAKYRHLFKMEDDDDMDDEFGMDDDDEDEEEGFFPGLAFNPFGHHTAPIIPQMIFHQLMSGLHPAVPHDEDDDDDDGSLPDLVDLNGSVHTSAANDAEDDADSLPDLVGLD